MRSRLRVFPILAAIAALPLFGKAQSANDEFVRDVSAIVVQAVFPELAKHPERLDGEANISFELDPQGHQSQIEVVSTTGNQFVEETIRRTIHTLKFEPVPQHVLDQCSCKSVTIACKWRVGRPQ